MAGDWRKSLRPASFRGVPFYISTSDREGGRRIAEYQYPFFDRPIIDDFGRAPVTLNVTAYILGSAYIENRDRLISAIENQANPGEFIHPTFGSFQVICKTYKVSESQEKGGYCEFSLEFKEALSVNDSLTQTQSAALESAANQFIDELSGNSILSGLDDEPFILEQAVADFNTCLEEVSTYTDRYSARNQTLSNLAARLRETRRTASSILKSPGRFVQGFKQDLIDLGNALDPRISLGVVSKFYNTSQKGNPIKGSSIVNRVQRENQSRILKGFEKSSVAISTRYFVSSTASRETFTFNKNRLVERIQQAYDEVFSDLEYIRLRAIESLLLDVYEQRLNELPTETPANITKNIGSSISKEYARFGNVTDNSSPLKDIYS